MKPQRNILPLMVDKRQKYQGDGERNLYRMDYQLMMLERPNTSHARCEILARNVWRIGLLMKAHRDRVAREEKQIKLRQKEAAQKSKRIRTGLVRSGGKWKRFES